MRTETRCTRTSKNGMTHNELARMEAPTDQYCITTANTDAPNMESLFLVHNCILQLANHPRETFQYYSSDANDGTYANRSDRDPQCRLWYGGGSTSWWTGVYCSTIIMYCNRVNDTWFPRASLVLVTKRTCRHRHLLTIWEIAMHFLSRVSRQWFTETTFSRTQTLGVRSLKSDMNNGNGLGKCSVAT